MPEGQVRGLREPSGPKRPAPTRQPAACPRSRAAARARLGLGHVSRDPRGRRGTMSVTWWRRCAKTAHRPGPLPGAASAGGRKAARPGRRPGGSWPPARRAASRAAPLPPLPRRPVPLLFLNTGCPTRGPRRRGRVPPPPLQRLDPRGQLPDEPVRLGQPRRQLSMRQRSQAVLRRGSTRARRAQQAIITIPARPSTTHRGVSRLLSRTSPNPSPATSDNTLTLAE